VRKVGSWTSSQPDGHFDIKPHLSSLLHPAHTQPETQAHSWRSTAQAQKPSRLALKREIKESMDLVLGEPTGLGRFADTPGRYLILP
ncbi:hypothetical protein GDO81_005289, partial [Engystomops pustulosus]